MSPLQSQPPAAYGMCWLTFMVPDKWPFSLKIKKWIRLEDIKRRNYLQNFDKSLILLVLNMLLAVAGCDLFREFNLNPMKLLAITGVGFRIYMYFLFYLFICLHQSGMFSHSMWDVALWPGIEPGLLALGAPSLSHWTTREPLPVPRLPRY